MGKIFHYFSLAVFRVHQDLQGSVAVCLNMASNKSVVYMPIYATYSNNI